MRHQVAGKKLGRDIKSRKALLNNLTNSLFLRGEITTTQAKAKFVQSHAEKIITKAKKTKLASRRAAVSSLIGESIKKLFEEIAPSFSDRNGGYTRIIKLSSRVGDNAPMAKIQLVNFDKTKIVNSKIKIKAKSIKRKQKVKEKIKPKTVEKPKSSKDVKTKDKK